MAGRRKDHLGDYLATLLGQLEESLRVALLDGEERAVHQSRVATRRLAAGLALYEPVLSPDLRAPVAKTLKRLRRKLGRARDLDVMIGHLRDLPAPAGGRAAEWAISVMQAQRRHQQEKLAQTDLGKLSARLAKWRLVEGEILEAAMASRTLLAESIHAGLADFSARADAVAAGGSRDFHAVRIAGKSIRYLLEMARISRTAGVAGGVATFKRLQDSLGEWHDFAVLAHRLLEMSASAALPEHDSLLCREVLKMSADALTLADRSARRFIVLWRGRREKLLAMVDQRFILSKSLQTSAEVGPPDASENA